MKQLRRIAMLIAAAIIVCLIAPYATTAEEKAPKAAAALLDFVPPDAAWFITVRVGDLWAHPAIKAWGKAGEAWPKAWRKSGKEMPGDLLSVSGLLERFLDSGREVGVAPSEIERITRFSLKDPRQELTAISTVKPYDRQAIIAATKADAEQKLLNGRFININKHHFSVYFLDERTFLLGHERDVDAILHRTPGKKEGLAASASPLMSENHLAVFGVDVAALLPFPPDMPPPEAMPYKALLKTRLGLLVVDLDDQIKANLRLTFADAAKAKEAATALDDVMGQFRNQFADGATRFSKMMESPKVEAILDDIQASLKAAKADQKGATVEVEAAVKIDPDRVTAALTDSVRMMENAAQRDVIPNSLKQLALAVQNYNDANGLLPAAARYGKNGKPVLSWRVMLLPYIEQGELYQEFHLDEPWDSEHNKKLLAKMPEIFAPKDADAFKNHETFFQAFVGKGTVFEPPAKPQADSLIVPATAPPTAPGTGNLSLGNGIHLNAGIPDGLSNTILFVEAKKAVPWTKPDDIPFDDGKLLPKLGGLSKDGFFAAMCDGSVRFIPLTVKEDDLRTWIIRNSGKARPELGK